MKPEQLEDLLRYRIEQACETLWISHRTPGLRAPHCYPDRPGVGSSINSGAGCCAPRTVLEYS